MISQNWADWFGPPGIVSLLTKPWEHVYITLEDSLRQEVLPQKGQRPFCPGLYNFLLENSGEWRHSFPSKNKSGCRESNSAFTHPKRAYCRYTTPRFILRPQSACRQIPVYYGPLEIFFNCLFIHSYHAKRKIHLQLYTVILSLRA